MAFIATTADHYMMAVLILTTGLAHNDEADFICAGRCIFVHRVLPVAGVSVSKVPMPLYDIMFAGAMIKEMNGIGFMVDIKSETGFTTVAVIFKMDLRTIGVFTSGLTEDAEADNICAVYFIEVFRVLAVTNVTVTKVPDILDDIVFAF